MEIWKQESPAPKRSELKARRDARAESAAAARELRDCGDTKRGVDKDELESKRQKNG